MSTQALLKPTPQEYLAMERRSNYKSEYVNGEIFAMAGASEAHNLIVANVIRELSVQLKGKSCKVYPGDLRVKIPHTGLYTYPDVSVVCGKAEFDDDQQDTLLNPILIIEVLSTSTESDDRGAKFAHYRKLDSVLEYLLISQERRLIERYVRQPDSRFWMLSDADGLQETMELTSIHCQLALAEVYDKVEFMEG